MRTCSVWIGVLVTVGVLGGLWSYVQAHPSDGDSTPACLRKIEAVNLSLNVAAPDAKRRARLEAALEQAVNERLGKIGLRRQTRQEQFVSGGWPRLYVTATISRPENDGPLLYLVNLQFLQNVALADERNVVLPAVTWDMIDHGLAKEQWEKQIIEAVAVRLEIFLNDVAAARALKLPAADKP